MDHDLPPTHDRPEGPVGRLRALLRRRDRGGPRAAAADPVTPPRQRATGRPAGTSTVVWDADRQALHAVITLAVGGVHDLGPLWREVRRELDAERVGRHLPPEAWNGYEVVLTVVLPDDVDGDALRDWLDEVARDPAARVSTTEVSLVPSTGR